MSGLSNNMLALLLGGGVGLNALGGLVGNASQNRAIRRAGDDNALNLRGQQGLLGSGVFGGGFGQMPTWQYLYGQGLERQDPNLINQGLNGINSFVNSQGGPVIDQQRRLADTVSARQTGNLGYFDDTTNRLGQFSAQTGNNLGNFMSRSRDDLLRGYDQGAANIVGSAQGNENNVQQWGTGQAMNIRRDAGRNLSAANMASDRALSGRGLGNSSLLVGAQMANRRNNQEATNSALQDLANARIDRQTAARNQTLGLQTNLHNTRAGLQADQNNNIAGSMERLGENQIGREYQRAGDRMGLENQNLTRDIGLRQDPINTLYQTLNGQVMNPYSSINFGVGTGGGSGNALSSIGGALAGTGSYLMANQNNMNMLQQLMRSLRPAG